MPKLGVLAFVENGVRNALVPVLVSYFQDRRKIVKWHGVEPSLKMMMGGGPRGGLVPSNLPDNGYVIPNTNMKTQQYINQISEWTQENKMQLNQKKCE